MPGDLDELEKKLSRLSLKDMQTDSAKDPSEFALELFEVGASKEKVGLLTEAVKYYRVAFALDDRVDIKYRKKLISELPPLEKRKDGVPVVDNRFQKLNLSKIKVRKLLSTFKHCKFEPLDESKDIAIDALLDEILMKICRILVVNDPTSWFNLSMTCKKFSYLGFYDMSVWRLHAALTYHRQAYKRESRIEYRHEARKKWGKNYIKMLKQRPYLKYKGVYVSTVINQKQGGRTEFSDSWTAPFRILTYYRYLRFFQDGTCLKLLTILEPNRVIPKLHRNWRKLIQMDEECTDKEWHRIFEGKFTMSNDGIVEIESEGPYDEWRFQDKLRITSSGKYSKHDRLQWIEMGYVTKKTGDPGNFDIRSEKDFKFMKVPEYDGTD